MNKIETILTERGERYGKFSEHATISQQIKVAMSKSINWERLDDPKREALEMIAHKIARILNGDPDYRDSWDDIIGYSQLISNSLDEI